MVRTLALVLCLAAAPSAFAQDSQAVVLKERPVSMDGVITLSDLFENTGEAGDTLLARAPAPGAQLSLDPGFVQQSAARAGLHWANAGGLLRVTVERAARTVSPTELTAMIEESLFVEHGRTFAVSLSNTRQALHAPLESLGAPELLSFDHDARSGLFRAEIAPYPGGAPVTVSGRAHPVQDVPVLIRAMGRGETITDADVRWVQLPADQVRGEMVLAEADLVGMAARRALPADRPLRSHDVEPPVVINRGELVSLVYQIGALTLTAQARALENAADGEPARFVNLQSNRTVEALADGPGRARVYGGLGAARLQES